MDMAITDLDLMHSYLALAEDVAMTLSLGVHAVTSAPSLVAANSKRNCLLLFSGFRKISK